MRVLVLVLAGLAFAAPASGRQAPLPTVSATGPIPAYAPPVEPSVTSRLVGPGILGGGLGWAVGAVAVGVPLAKWNPFGSSALDDGSWTPGLIIGFELGEAIGIPLGVHRANGGRGDLRTSMIASLAIAAVGTALLWTDDFDAVFETRRSQTILLAVPLAQVITSIFIERRPQSGP